MVSKICSTGGFLMAGSIVTVPSVGAADWTDFITHVEELRKGHIEMTLTNFTGTGDPDIGGGSEVEVNGALYKFAANETITGTPDTDATNYIQLTVSGSSITAAWASANGTWSDAKQGYYTGNDRFVGQCYYDGTNYTQKIIYTKEFYNLLNVMRMVDDNIDFYTDNTKRVTISEDGNLGVAEADPDESIEVAGGVKITGSINGNYVANSLFADVGSGFARFFSCGADGSTKGAFKFNGTASDGSPNDAHMVISAVGDVGVSTGSLGVGLDDPDEKLEVAGGVKITSTITGNYQANSLLIDNSAGTSRFFSCGADGSTKGTFQFSGTASDGSPNEAHVTIDATGDVDVVLGDLTVTAGNAIVTAGDLTVTAGDSIVTAGNLGLGVSDPDESIEVAGGIKITSTITGNYQANSLLVDNNSGISRFFSCGADGSTKGTFQFNGTASDGAPNDTQMTIDETGDVDITGYVDAALGRQIAFAGNWSSATTQDTVFDALAPYIPNTGDIRIASGMFNATDDPSVNRIERVSSTVIDIHYSISATETLTDGSATTLTQSVSVTI
jgi:hypothetical protein